MAALIGYLGMVVGTLGVFFGFFFINHPATSTVIVTATTVAAVGILGFIRHLFFHKADAKRLGMETERPDWAYEVGFANLAFGVAAVVATAARLGMAAQAVILLAYAVYLLQAGILHGYRYFTEADKKPAKLWRSCVATLWFAVLMLFFAIRALGGC